MESIDSLKYFSLAGKMLKLDSAEDLSRHIGPLISMDDVQLVKFSGNTLGVGACKALGEVLATKPMLQFVDFSDIFTGRLLSEIPDALSSLLTPITNLPTLTTVNVNDNAFGINSVEPVVAFLSEHVPLQHLSLNNNGLGPQAGTKVADALSTLHARKVAARRAGQQVPDLETIICGRNRLENGSMEAWARAMRLHANIRTIRMVQNGIRPEGMIHIVQNGFAHTAALEVLDLQDNTFSLAGAVELARTVPGLRQLRELVVSDTLFSSRGCGHLFTAFSRGQNNKLETLRMQYAEMTSQALKQLHVVAVTSLPALRRVDLNGNKFMENDEALASIRDLLEERRTRLGLDSETTDDGWGIDSLSDLDFDDDDDEDEKEESEGDEDAGEEGKSREAVEEKAEKMVADAEKAQEEPVAAEKDATVDELVEAISKVGL